MKKGELSVCPSKFRAVLALPEPIEVPCTLPQGHEGWHRFQVFWGDSSSVEADPCE